MFICKEKSISGSTIEDNTLQHSNPFLTRSGFVQIARFINKPHENKLLISKLKVQLRLNTNRFIMLKRYKFFW